ncbi:penicillin-binding protein [Marinilabiliaceae bacterium ANBcel2]|nr:penicillin-binding protein [Marinilabiliaceae bacterium ANBcel2]
MSLKRQIMTRVALVYLVFAGLAVWLIIELISLKLFEAEKWNERAVHHSRSGSIVEAKRGDILDVTGYKLAISVPIYRLYMDLLAEGLTDEVFNDNIDSLAICLSHFFGDKSSSQYKRDLVRARQRGSRYYLINPRRISYTDLKKIREFPIFRRGRNRGGFIPEEFIRREKPFGSLAARTIGKLYGESSMGGMVGLERAYDERLRGVSGSSGLKRISGSWVSEIIVPPVDGYDLVTTIDIGVQDVAEHALRDQLKRHNASHGVAVLMEVHTGDIKAIVNLHRSRPGIYIEDYFNYAIGESVEPGSTFKLAAMLAAFEDNAFSLNDSIDTGNGSYQFYDRTMRDSRIGGWGRLRVSEVFEYSSNIGISKLIVDSYQSNPRRFVDKLYSMGLNEPLGIEIKGEGTPLIKYPGDNSWSGVTLPWMSIGYEVQMTPLQILSLYNAVANDGVMVKPRFVKGYSRHGSMVEQVNPEVLNSSIASASTIKKVQELLKGVVERGTARNLRNTAFPVAGKTGTAQVAKGASGYQDGGIEYRASFAGYFPADNPKYSCIVMVSAPSNNVYYGNVVAGTVFREIADRVYANDLENIDVFVSSKDKEYVNGVYPYAKGGPKDELTIVLDRLGFPYYKRGNVDKWISTLASDSGVVFRPLSITEELAPSVIGMGAKDAVAVLENIGFNVILHGFGRVVYQSVKPGTPFRQGNDIVLQLQ